MEVKSVILVAALFTAQGALAQNFKVCNETADNLFFAYGVFMGKVTGWYSIDSGKCWTGTLKSTDPSVDVYAKQDGNALTTTNYTSTMGRTLCVINDRFSLDERLEPNLCSRPDHQVANFAAYKFAGVSNFTLTYYAERGSGGRTRGPVTGKSITDLVPYPPNDERAKEEYEQQQARKRAAADEERRRREADNRRSADDEARARINAQAQQRSQGNTASCSGVMNPCGPYCYNPAKDKCETANDGRKVVCGALDKFCPAAGRCLWPPTESCEGLR